MPLDSPRLATDQYDASPSTTVSDMTQQNAPDHGARGRTTPTESDLLPEEVAPVLRVTPRTVRDLVAAGDLAGYRIGRQTRIPRDALDEFRRRPARPVAPSAGDDAA